LRGRSPVSASSPGPSATALGRRMRS